LAVAAQSAVRDAESNSASVFNILETLAAAGFPFFVQKLSLLFMMTRDANDPPQHQLMLRISQGAHGDDAFPVDCNFLEHFRTRNFIHLNGFVFRGEGVVRFGLFNGDQELAAWPVEVSLMAPPPVQVIAPNQATGPGAG